MNTWFILNKTIGESKHVKRLREYFFWHGARIEHTSKALPIIFMLSGSNRDFPEFQWTKWDQSKRSLALTMVSKVYPQFFDKENAQKRTKL